MIETLKTLYNALSLANVNNLGELRTALREADARTAQTQRPARTLSETPAIAHIYPAA